MFLPIDFTPDGSAGDGDERVKFWSRATFDHFNSLYSSKEASEVGLCLMTGYDLKNTDIPDPWWADMVFGFRNVSTTSAEAKLLHLPPSCVKVWAFTTYMLTCRSYLPWLMAKFKRNGGHVEKRHITSLSEPSLKDYNMIINCVGMGARNLIGDKSLVPVRGQALLVEAPWVKHFVVSYMDKDTLTYIQPRAMGVVLGGTAQEGNWKESPDPETFEMIRKRCEALLPGLENERVIDSWVGLRPVRRQIRLEMEHFPLMSAHPPVIHCYGHGGQGVVLHWGCALEVGGMVEDWITGGIH